MPHNANTTVSTAVTAPPHCETSHFYRQVLQVFQQAHVPFLVGGAFALRHFTGIERDTKDLDLFIRKTDFERACELLAQAGFTTELTFPHWLAKVYQGEAFIDLIFNSGNGLTLVDDEWFDHAAVADVLGMRVLVHPAEEMLWSKAFIMERERYDGADVAHILKACAATLDWPRLMRRFGPHWRVLLSHLVLFGFIYPELRHEVPAWVMADLLQRADAELRPAQHDTDHVCRGTLLSRQQYLDDLAQAGFRDGRLDAPGTMTEEHIAIWTQAITESR
ncbi:MAG: nucleotidyltransferase [Aquabacterium sp.]